MHQTAKYSAIGSLLVIAVILTVVDSYIPHEITLVRQIISGVELVVMLVIAAITLRVVLEDL